MTVVHPVRNFGNIAPSSSTYTSNAQWFSREALAAAPIDLDPAPAVEFICHDYATAPWAGVLTKPHEARSLLVAEVRDESGTITQAAREAVHMTLLRAIELWRRSCRACDAWSFVGARIDDEHYVLSPVARLLRDYLGPERSQRQVLSDPLSPVITPQVAYDDLNHILRVRAGSAPFNMGFPRYLKLAHDSKELTTLCQSADIDKYPALKRLRGGMCSRQEEIGGTPIARLRLLSLDGPTSCGKDQNIVACEPDSLLVEVNARDYSFVDYQSGKVIFGKGSPVDLLPVVAHEVGHWLGVGHLRERDAIMSSSMEGARCLTAHDGTALLGLYEGFYSPTAIKRRALRYRSEQGE
ncbi:MAG: matrixin family metalloprotease [Burkholderiales bacterium]|nr:matrixin family metalloprotease [Burkholderiales bacterium]